MRRMTYFASLLAFVLVCVTARPDAADAVIRGVVTDSAGNAVELRPVAGDFTVNEWTAVARFDTGDGDLTFECGGESPDSEIRIGALPSTGGFVTGIVVGIVVPLVLGGTGVIWLIVLAVLYGTGAPRQQVPGNN